MQQSVESEWKVVTFLCLAPWTTATMERYIETTANYIGNLSNYGELQRGYPYYGNYMNYSNYRSSVDLGSTPLFC